MERDRRRHELRDGREYLAELFVFQEGGVEAVDEDLADRDHPLDDLVVLLLGQLLDYPKHLCPRLEQGADHRVLDGLVLGSRIVAGHLKEVFPLIKGDFTYFH